jgi:hypothetical protein
MSNIQFPFLPQIYRFCTPKSTDSLPFKVVKCASALIALVGALWAIKSLFSGYFASKNISHNNTSDSISSVKASEPPDLDAETAIDPSVVEKINKENIRSNLLDTVNSLCLKFISGKTFTLRRAEQEIMAAIRDRDPQTNHSFWVSMPEPWMVHRSNLYLYRHYLKLPTGESWMQHITETLVQKNQIELLYMGNLEFQVKLKSQPSK